jgi:hypothetical protein
VIADADSGRVFYERAVREGDTFSITFVHSVNNSPVTDVFRIEGGARIRPVQARYSAFGAGMPDALGEGLTLSREGADMVVTGFTRTEGELRYIVGTVSDHVLSIQGREVSLRDMCGKNAHIVLSIK